MKAKTVGQASRMASEVDSIYPWRFARKGSRLYRALFETTRAQDTQDDREYILTRVNFGSIRSAVRLGLYPGA